MDKDGLSLLSYAAESGNSEVVQLLLVQDDVDVNLKDKDGQSPLLYAAQTWNSEQCNCFWHKVTLKLIQRTMMVYPPLICHPKQEFQNSATVFGPS